MKDIYDDIKKGNLHGELFRFFLYCAVRSPLFWLFVILCIALIAGR